MKRKIIIPAKGTSSRIEQKNTRPFFRGQSLLDVCLGKVIAARDLIDPTVEIVVNSEDNAILALAKKYGATPQKRPQELATSDTTPQELAEHLAEVNDDAEYLIIVHCTNPLLPRDVIETALIINPARMGEFDSINTAVKIRKHIWHNVHTDSAIYRTPLYDTQNRPATQDIDGIIALEYSVNIISRDLMLARRDFIGKNPAFLFIEHDNVIDIDEPLDFEIAKGIYAQRMGVHERNRSMNIIKK
jgi:CMP-N-acetylneuraminic acid synthetase